MIITLKRADFSANNIGNINSISVSRTIPLPSIPKSYTTTSSGFGSNTIRATTYGNVLAGDILEVNNPDGSFNNQMQVHQVATKSSPVFVTVDGAHNETWVKALRSTYDSDRYTFAENMRFIAIMQDANNSSTRDFTGYEFCVYKLRRNFETKVANAVQAYHGTYNQENGTINWGDNGIRAFTVLDLKKGDVVASTLPNYKFNIFELNNNALTFVSQHGTNYTTTHWTSDKDQRVLLLARDTDQSDGTMASADLSKVFTVTFNS